MGWDPVSTPICTFEHANDPRGTRYDKLTANFLSAVALATAVAFWL